MRKVLGWIFTPFFGFWFFMTLCIFHVLQVIAFNIFGYQAHKKVVDGMGIMLTWCMRVFMGTRVELSKIPDNIPMDKPWIVIANHQSLFDVNVLVSMLAAKHPKFVAKIELASGVPGVSYNLRNGGSVVIDRKNAAQALSKMEEFGKYIQDNKYCACIFPEGTRAADGQMKQFKVRGLATLFKEIPDAVIIPVALDGLWKMVEFNYKPIPFGVTVKAQILPPIDKTGKTHEQMVEECEYSIRKHLNQLDGYLPTEEKKN